MANTHLQSAAKMTAISFLLLACSCSKPASFEDNFNLAKSNAASGAGLAYDQQLKAQLAGTPDLPRSLSVCLAGDTRQTSAHGYFQINSPTDYKLILEPKGKLSHCLARIFEGRSVPAPPTTPYLNSFEFAISL